VILSDPGRIHISTLPDLILRFDGSLPARTEVKVYREGFLIAREYYPSPVRLSSPNRQPLAVRPALAVPGSGARSRSYRGSLDLLNISGKIRIIDELSMEEYLAGVVGAEMPSSFCRAALEAQAVASRTYALYHLRRMGSFSLDQGFNSTSLFQVYRGFSGETEQVQRAVRSTAGWVLTYQGKIFPSYYHSTCGGSTTSGSWTFGLPEIPPLRGVPCKGCVRSLTHHWQFRLHLKDVEQLLLEWADENGISMKGLRGLRGIDPLPGGYLRYVQVLHGGGSFEIRADIFRRILNRGGLSDLRSTSFQVEPGEDPGVLVFRGSGWGHGVGMCQYGADWLGRDSSFGQVLAHYYPGSELKKVY